MLSHFRRETNVKFQLFRQKGSTCLHIYAYLIVYNTSTVWSQILWRTSHDPNKIRFSLKFEHPRNFFLKIRNFLFVFVLQLIQKENVQLKKKMNAKRPESLVYIIKQDIRTCVPFSRPNGLKKSNFFLQNLIFSLKFLYY